MSGLSVGMNAVTKMRGQEFLEGWEQHMMTTNRDWDATDLTMFTVLRKVFTGVELRCNDHIHDIGGVVRTSTNRRSRNVGKIRRK